MATQDKNKQRLQELRHSDFEIADGEPDITGWDASLTTGEEIGEVKDLIFDTASRKVRYLKVRLKGKTLNIDSRDVLVPIGLAQLKHLTHKVLLTNVTKEQLLAIPEYDDDVLDSIYETSVLGAFGGQNLAETDGNTGNDFYSHEHFNDQQFYFDRPGTLADPVENNNEIASNHDDTIKVVRENLEVGKREVETGGIRLRSRIVETPVQETVNLRQENVNVERTPVDRTAGNAEFREQHIEVLEHAEVPVVQKEARVVEEISLSKDVDEREETIRETVRQTEVDVDHLSDEERSRSRH
jgi:uncharacterized protein (TIGR02271 family)